MIKVVSFDIGNTLIKRSGDNSLIQQLATLSTESKDIVKCAYREHFLTRHISLEKFCEKTNISSKIILNKIDQYYKFKKPDVVWEDVPFALEQLKKKNIVLITISNKSYRNPFDLNSYGLQSWFSQEIYSCDIGYAKPNISIFRYAQQLLQIKPHEILHIGDSYVSDYLGAQKVDWNSVLLCRHYCQTSIRTSNISAITSLYDLPSYLQEFT